jgi:proteasome accessory factor A
MIEEGWFADSGVDLGIDMPVSSLRAISHDSSLKHTVKLRDGRTATALEVQSEMLGQARKFVETHYGADADFATLDVLAEWEQVLGKLAEDPMSLAGELDWVAKLSLLEGYRDREGLDWSAPKLQLVDLQYTDVRPDKGLYNRLVARGRMRRLVSDEEIARAVTEPPTDTRAYFRGRCLSKYAKDVAAASWDSVIFDVGRDTLQRVPMMEPLRGTKAHVDALLARCETAAQLVDEISSTR